MHILKGIQTKWTDVNVEIMIIGEEKPTEHNALSISFLRAIETWAKPQPDTF